MSINVKEGDTVEVGALLGEVNAGKLAPVQTTKVKSVAKDQQSYIPPKTTKKKNIAKEIKKKSKKTISNQQETLTLVDEAKEKDSNGALILDTLAEEDTNITREEKYVPPKTRKHLSPSVRKIVEENNIDISHLEGTGKSGRISKGDLINLMGNIPESSKRKITHGLEERVKMTRLRLTIAKRLKEAQDSAAMLTTFNEVDVQNIMQMRQDYQEDFHKKYSVKLGFMSFFVKASVVALKNFPSVNAEIEGDNIYLPKTTIIYL